MKNLNLPVAGLILVLIAGCKKEEFQQKAPDSKIEAKIAGTSESEWKKAGSWQSVQQNQFSVFHTNIPAPEISATDAESGIVRVFKIANSSESERVQSLPFEEKVGNARYYWYYQITEGNILLAVDVYGSQKNPVDRDLFKYIRLSPQAIQEMDGKGLEQVELMDLEYKELRQLSN